MKILAIALNTSREAIRNKVLYSIMLFAVLLTSISAAFGSVSIGDTLKFVKDFSLFSVSLFGVVTTVVLGVNLLSKELEKRTIYNLLSKPVARWEFLLGKYLGLLATLTIMMMLMSVGLFGLIWALEGRFDAALVPVLLAMLMELAVLLAVAVFFSSIVVTPILAGLFTIAAFVAGRSAAWLAYFLGDDQPPLLRSLIGLLYAALPHLDRFYVADRVVSGHALGASYYAYAGIYAVAYISVLLLLSSTIFRRREFV
ncbi:MAG: ABC transporter permease subunit [Deltaproteobacteria bacterium]|nr:ABC transporter permease subunit [Deltaproteobacteria bacterium]